MLWRVATFEIINCQLTPLTCRPQNGPVSMKKWHQLFCIEVILTLSKKQIQICSFKKNTPTLSVLVTYHTSSLIQCVTNIRIYSNIWIFFTEYWIFKYEYWIFHQRIYSDIQIIDLQYSNIDFSNIYTNKAFSTL